MSESVPSDPSENGQATPNTSTPDRLNGRSNPPHGLAGDTGSRGGPVSDPADPFDPAALRLSQDFASTIGVKKVFTRVRCGKPEKHAFVRVHPGADWRLETCVLELKGSQDRPGQETYLVQAPLWPELTGDVRPAVLFTAVTRQKVPFLWRCWLPSPDGRANLWTDTLLDAARLAEQKWIKVSAGDGRAVWHGGPIAGAKPWPA